MRKNADRPQGRMVPGRPGASASSWQGMCERLIAAELELTRLKAENQKLRRLIFIDPLTGLQNRAALERDILPRWAGGAGGAVIVLDLDHFKAVNDRNGHAVGDRVLADCGRLIQSVVRKGDEAVRYGGEEFVVLLERTTLEAAMEVAERLLTAIESHAFDGGLRMTASAGVAAAPRASWHNLFLAADEALYAAKSSGRNRAIAAGSAAGIEAPSADAAPPPRLVDFPEPANRIAC